MTLDRDAARALFDNAAPMPANAGGAPFVSAAPFAPAGNDALTARMSGSARKGPDWRLVAPVGVAALCAGAALLIIGQRDDARPGKDVAATTATRPLPPPVAMPEPVETAAVTPPAAAIVEPSAPPPATAVRTRARSERAARPAPARRVAVAPSASDASSDVSAREPYVPPPVLDAPTPVIITPAAPPPVIAPEPQPETPPQF